MISFRQSAAILLSLLVVSAACATTGTQAPPQVAPELAAAPAETLWVETPATSIPAVEPGRFDLGKMWTFENAPLEYFEEAYGFRPTTDWLEHVQLATLRIPGCTASFVSADGLVMTNHHCARRAATNVTRPNEDLLTDGFYAPTLGEERRATNMYADQLVEIHDVTSRVEAALDPAVSEEEQVQVLAQRVRAVGDSASAASGLRCGVTPLYQGGKYSMYCYKRYSDVRVVFVPELAIGYFGGDPDNFTYPRYNLDFSFLRVYGDDGEPLTPDAYFSWSQEGAGEGEAVFVIGNPGSTLRLNTFAQLEYRRDYQEPLTIRVYESRAKLLEHFMDHHPDQRARYINTYFGYMNALKLYYGRLKALRDSAIMGRKLGFEQQFQQAVRDDPTLNAKYGHLWDDIADMREKMAVHSPILNGLRQGGFTRSQTLATARDLIEYAEAIRSQSLPDTAIERIRSSLAARSYNTDLDRHMLELQLDDAQFLLGKDEPFVREALAGQGFVEAARAIMDGSPNVLDPTKRRRLLDDPSLIRESDDRALQLMRIALPRLNESEVAYQQLQSAETIRVQQLARALFDVYGTSIAPDATFTLRLADGVVQGYEYNGTMAAPFTTFYGLYDRHYAHAGKTDWTLPERWMNPPPEFDLGTPLNMVSTNDITGGNSGSPVINRNLEVVGLIFDGNIESLSGDFIYTTEVARAVSVRSEGMLEALRHIYGAQRIANELTAPGATDGSR